jgi:hypothetical protein
LNNGRRTAFRQCWWTFWSTDSQWWRRKYIPLMQLTNRRETVWRHGIPGRIALGSMWLCLHVKILWDQFTFPFYDTWREKCTPKFKGSR